MVWGRIRLSTHSTVHSAVLGSSKFQIYDLSIQDPDSESPKVVWTPHVKYSDDEPHVPFQPPGRPIGWSPFSRHVQLPVGLETTIDTYIDRFDDFESAWAGSIGNVRDDILETKHGWNITRVVFTNAAGLGGQDEPPHANISIAAVYIEKTKQRGFEFVWWELVPVIWLFGRPNASWFNSYDVPQSLEDRLIQRGAKLDL